MDIDMQVIHRESKYVAYRARKGDTYRHRDAARKRRSRAADIPEFIGVDGEGVGRGKNHHYVLLGVGDQQYENPRGIEWQEAFDFLYEQFKEHPRAAFVGFYLGYDFNQILKTLPLNVAFMLLKKEGKAMRKKPENKGQRSAYYPVRHDGWEIEMLGFKRLQIRPIADGCQCGQKGVKCPLSDAHGRGHLPWMSVCDAGAFFQMSFLKVIHPDKWADDPDGPVCSMDQFKRIETGKEKRDHAQLDKDMRAYNIEENLLLSVVMSRMAKGFHSVGIKPAKDQWYGPGATASKWLAKVGAVKKNDLIKKHDKKPRLMPKWFWDACKRSYFGGWFEIFSHGLITGTSYNYDINNAYPFAAVKLPHICEECRYKRGQGNANSHGPYLLRYCTVYSKGTRIGAMPHRNKQGAILRPAVTKGWYWDFEIEASRRAGLVKRVVAHEWVEFTPCHGKGEHNPPFLDIQDLYNLRLRVGKDSAQGWAIKLNNNSVYGKFAQSVGAAPYNNWLYASYITAHCRSQILDAIATHPDKADAVLMVATDGVCFDKPHPKLAISKLLGDWAHTEYTDLCLFKPGVYWHKEGREALLKVKSRGVPRDEFIKEIDKVQAKFQHFLDIKQWPGWDFHKVVEQSIWEGRDLDYWFEEENWPRFMVHVNFRMKSCLQALQEGNWESAGMVQEKFPVWQDSNPHSKRDHIKGVFFNHEKGRIDSSIHTLEADQIQTYYHKEITPPKHMQLGFGFDGDARGPQLEAYTILRDRPANYDVPIEEIVWENVWGG